MKIFLLLLVTIGSNLVIHAQILPNVYNKNSPTYFIDNIRFKGLPIFDGNQIDSIKVTKDNSNGKIYIKTKNPKGFHFITLTPIAKNKGLPEKSILYMLDGKFLKDTTEVSIDSSYILRSVLIPSSDFKYLDNKVSFTIINIMTRNKENLDKEKIIYIRGRETTSIKN